MKSVALLYGQSIRLLFFWEIFFEFIAWRGLVVVMGFSVV
jgi:hypothetical protein